MGIYRLDIPSHDVKLCMSLLGFCSLSNEVHMLCVVMGKTRALTIHANSNHSTIQAGLTTILYCKVVSSPQYNPM